MLLEKRAELDHARNAVVDRQAHTALYKQLMSQYSTINLLPDQRKRTVFEALTHPIIIEYGVKKYFIGRIRVRLVGDGTAAEQLRGTNIDVPASYTAQCRHHPHIMSDEIFCFGDGKPIVHSMLRRHSYIELLSYIYNFLCQAPSDTNHSPTHWVPLNE